MWLLFLPALALAADPSLMSLGQTPGTCDDLAASSAATAFHVTVAALDVGAALLFIPVWRFLERREMLGGFARFLVGALLAAALAAVLVTYSPYTDGERVMMANTSCQHYFWLGSAAPVARGLVLGAMPAAALSLLFNLGVRLVTNRA